MTLPDIFSFSPISFSHISALFNVVMIDLILSADNGLVVGLAVGKLSKEQRRRAMAFGISLAVLARVIFTLTAVYLMAIKGVLFFGGLLLLWVAYKLWLDMKGNGEDDATARLASNKNKKFMTALWQIVIADISMSLDNVIAVAGASREHPVIMVFGLVLSIIMMATIATIIANLLKKYPLIAYIGLAILIYVSGKMLYEGLGDVVSLWS